MFDVSLSILKSVAAWQTRVVQPDRLKMGILMVLSVFFVLVAFDFYDHVTVPSLGEVLDIRLHELFIPTLIIAAIGLTVTSNSRIASVCGLGVIGYAIAMLFVMYGVPDLAMTQFAIETLTVVLFVFVLAQLPRFSRLSSIRTRRRDILVAIAGGSVMSAVAWAATAAHVPSRLSDFFAQNSLTEAKGRNLVNVILVDFRGLDTLGEIVVLTVAAIGVFALIRMGREPQLDGPSAGLAQSNDAPQHGVAVAVPANRGGIHSDCFPPPPTTCCPCCSCSQFSCCYVDTTNREADSSEAWWRRPHSLCTP